MATRISYLKGQKLYTYLTNLRAEIRYLYRRAKKEGMSLDEIIKRRQELLSDDSVKAGRGNWSRLTGLDQARIFGYCDALSDELHDGLVFMYFINGKWYSGDELVKHKDGLTLKDATKENGSFCYRMPDGTFRVWSPLPQ